MRLFLSFAGAVALAVGFVSPAAGWTVSGSGIGGSVTASTTSNVTFTDRVTGSVITCAAGPGFTFNMLNGTGQSGTALGRVTATSTATCTLPLGSTDTGQLSGIGPSRWLFNMASYSAGVSTGSASVASYSFAPRTGTCDVQLTGTGAIRYTNSTHGLTFNGGNFTATSTSGCTGLFNTNDVFIVTGGYTVSPTSLQIFDP